MSSLPARISEKIQITETCWTWLAYKDVDGYGQVKIDKRMKVAHRAVYELLVGPIPEGLICDHLCRNRNCVNPAHIEIVTQRENVLRGVGPSAQHAGKTHCPSGHAYSAENTNYARGKRDCRICRKKRDAAAWKARSAARMVKPTAEVVGGGKS